MRAARSVLALGVGAILAAAAPVAGVHAEDAGLAKRIDGVVSKQVQQGGPGCAVAVVVSGVVVHRKGYGLASIESKTAIGPETLFDLASCTKAFTATAILLLAERGALSLDDDVRKHLPELPARGKGRPVKVADLLGHTSGLTEYTGHVDEVKTLAQVLALAAAKRNRKGPGAEFDYCNTNYALLGLVVERVSKKSYREFLRGEIFGPLGMKTSDVLDATTPPLEGRAEGYKRRHAGRPPRRTWVPSTFDTPGITGDGGVFSSIDDLVRWDAALTASSLLKPETQARAFTSGRLDSGEETGYGLGWCVGENAGRRFADHSGSWMGTNTYIGRLGGVTVIVLSNDEDLDTGELGRAIAEVLAR